jgi:soluble lytic murein transglycosylase-like protein
MGPWLVVRGLVFGNLILILLTSALSANASTFYPTTSLPAAQSNAQPAAVQEAQTTEAEASVAEEQKAMGQSLAKSPVVPGTCEVSLAFPDSVRQWCGIITSMALNHGLPADLIAAVIWQESGGDPQALSRSGAVGLMQVMPRDGKAASFECINGPCFSNRPDTEQLFDAEFNVQYGTSMLVRLIERYGNLRDALKAYGPMDRGYEYADRVLQLYQQYGQ